VSADVGFTPWAEAQVGDLVNLNDGEDVPCAEVYPDKDRPLFCTRGEGHDGQHVATGNSIVLMTWEPS
jgi:hypothetical protein